jgi:hypothetical protein
LTRSQVEVLYVLVSVLSHITDVWAESMQICAKRQDSS